MGPVTSSQTGMHIYIQKKFVPVATTIGFEASEFQRREMIHAKRERERERERYNHADIPGERKGRKEEVGRWIDLFASMSDD